MYKYHKVPEGPFKLQNFILLFQIRYQIIKSCTNKPIQDKLSGNVLMKAPYDDGMAA